MPGASRTITINAPRDVVFDVVADYEKYPQFLPEVKSITLKNRNGNQVEAHYVAEIVKTIKYAVKLTEQKPEKVSWTYINGEFMKDNKGGWVLEDLGNGTTKATYTVEVTLGALVPKTIVNALVDTSLPKLLEAFKKRAEDAAKAKS